MDIDEEDTGFDIKLDELTGWEDCGCSEYVEYRAKVSDVKRLENNKHTKARYLKSNRSKLGIRAFSSQQHSHTKSVNTSLSLDMLKSIVLQDSARKYTSPETTNDSHGAPPKLLSNSIVSLPPANTILDPGMIMPVQEARSPLEKPFIVYNYSDSKLGDKPHKHRHIQLHVVTATWEASDTQRSHPQLPLLVDARNDAAPTEMKQTTRQSSDRSNRLGKPVTQRQFGVLEKATNRSGWLAPSHASANPLLQNEMARPKVVKQLCKNDKPTLRSHIVHGSMASQRRFSDVAKEHLNLSYQELPPNCPRRRSLCSDESEHVDAAGRSVDVYDGHAKPLP